MRKIFFALIAVVLVGSASAQSIGYGPKGGLNISMLTGSDMDFKARVNFSVGGFVEYDFAPEWSVELSAMYSRQGAKVDNVEVSLDEMRDGTIKLDFINLPLVAKFYPIDGMNVFLGPQFSFLVNAQEEMDGADQVDVKSSWRTFDIGAVAGVGYSWEFGMIAYAQYNMGFRDLYIGDNISTRSGVIQVGIGWRF